MYKKLFWAFYVGLILCNLKTTSQASGYMEAFEDEVQNNSCGKFTCNFSKTNKAHSYTDNSRRQVEIGSSVGPFGTTKHYAYSSTPVQSTVVTSHYECSRCEYDKGLTLGWLFYPSVPTIKIEQNDNIRVMTIDVGVTLRDVSSDLPICRRPYLSGKLEEIWRKAGLETTSYFWTGPLQALWEAA